MAQPSQTARALLEGETVATEDDFQEAKDDVTQTDVAAEEVRNHPDDPPVDPAYNFPVRPQSFARDLTVGLTAENYAAAGSWFRVRPNCEQCGWKSCRSGCSPTKGNLG